MRRVALSKIARPNERTRRAQLTNYAIIPASQQKHLVPRLRQGEQKKLAIEKSGAMDQESQEKEEPLQ
jgi:hypothetical protein